MSEPKNFWVGDRFVRPSLGEIQLGPERVHLEPRSMEVLQALATRPRELFPKQELIDAVWGKAFVGDEVLTHAIWDLRRALGDSASNPEFIQTIPKKGYRLIAPVRPVEERRRRRATDLQPDRKRGLSAHLLVLCLMALAVLAGLLWQKRESIRQFVEVVGDEHMRDPDIRPWVSLIRHDMDAIAAFLLGVKYAYRHELGSAEALFLAIEKDPDFPAPYVFATPTIFKHGSTESKAAHREQLDRMWSEASSFERPMIRWAIALLDQDTAEQLKQLRVALRIQPGNRPALMAQAAVYMSQDKADNACRIYEDLMDRRWDYPGLYPEAARCGIRRGDLDLVRRALELALGFDTVDVNVFALLHLLAIHDGNLGQAEEYERDREDRLQEIEPEGIDAKLLEEAKEFLTAPAETEDDSATGGSSR